jgi:hypothetical protein
MIDPDRPSPIWAIAIVALSLTGPFAMLPSQIGHAGVVPSVTANSAPVANFTSAIQRMVTLLALSGGGLLAFVWARVALSWFSNDIAKKVQAKDRARDALIGTILFTAAISGLLWGLAQWVVTGA